MMNDKQKILEKMEKARTWHELGVNIKDAYKALSEDSDEVQQLKDKIQKLTETNRNLRAELKRLKGN